MRTLPKTADQIKAEYWQSRAYELEAELLDIQVQLQLASEEGRGQPAEDEPQEASVVATGHVSDLAGSGVQWASGQPATAPQEA